jgi:uncharacterized protein YciI
MRWVVLFDDTPGMIPFRKKWRAEHVAYLEKNTNQILIGGGLRSMPDAPFVGGLWIVEADTYEEVVDLVLGDPYFNPDHRRFQILYWGKPLDRDVVL